MGAVQTPAHARGLSGIAGQSGQLHHPLLGLVRYKVDTLPDSGDSQTSATIAMMRQYALEDAGSPEIRADAYQARMECPDCGPAEAACGWVNRRVQFQRDEVTAAPWQAEAMGAAPDDVFVEALIRPRDMSVLCSAGRAIGDCDDFSMYTASLLTAMGVPCAFVTVAADPDSDQYSHVYVAGYPNGQRIALDTSHGEYPGWETGQGHRIDEWPVWGRSSAPWAVPALLLVIVGVALCQ
jgi:hypothetical protein